MKSEPKTSPEYDAFTNLVDRVLAVPHSVIKEREKAYREQAAKNPRKRGPKPKASSSGPASKS